MGLLGPIVGGVQHEGWVAPLFADGAEGSGSGGQGVSIRHADGSEEWRPDAAVIAYVAKCECGWRGQPWTRVSEGRVDRAQRLLAADGDDYYYLDQADEDLVLDEWRAHVAPWRTLEQVEDAAERVSSATTALDLAVAKARKAGASWADIGRAAGMTRQSAHERWANRYDYLDRPPRLNDRVLTPDGEEGWVTEGSDLLNGMLRVVLVDGPGSMEQHPAQDLTVIGVTPSIRDLLDAQPDD